MKPGLFPRQMRLVVADKEGEGVDLGRLSTKFEIRRTAEFSLATAKVTVFNLSAETIAKLSSKYTRIRLDAGYPQRIGTVFSGEVRNVFPTQDGPDKIVEIFAGDGAKDLENATVCLSFAAGMSLHGVLGQLIATMPNTSIGSLTLLTDRQIVGSFVLSGMTRLELNRLADSFGFRWSIQSGIFQAVDRGRSDGQPSLVVSRDTGMIGSPVASTTGVEVLTLLDPGLVPGRRISVVTAGAQVVQPGLSTLAIVPDFKVAGREFTEFDVLSVIHVGESRGQTWYTKAFAVPAGRL